MSRLWRLRLCQHRGTGIAADAKGSLFRTIGRDGKLTGNALHRVNAFELVRKRAAAAGGSRRASTITRFAQQGLRCFGSSADRWKMQDESAVATAG
jgi:hypothetical protein